MGAGDLKRKLEAVSASERHRMVLTTKKHASTSEGSEILKTKKDALAAVSLLQFNCVPGGSEMWLDHWRQMKAKAVAEAAASAVTKKRKRVVKQRLPKALIDLMVARPFRSVEDLTPGQLAKRSSGFREIYPLTTFVDGKLRDFEQDLIRQYNAQGYAEEEIEVSDSESEEEDAMAVED